MTSAEKARDLLAHASRGHGWVVADTDSSWVIFYDSRNRGQGVADVFLAANAPLVAAAPDLAETVIAQATQIAAAREAVNDLQAWGQLEPAAADTLLAILADQT